MKQDLEYYPPPDKSKRPRAKRIISRKKQSKWTGTLPDKYIAALVTRVSQSNIDSWINHLSSYHTRHSKSIYINQVAQWLKTTLLGFGYVDVTFHDYTESGYQLKNVICNKPGQNSKLILICAHYDCIMQNLNDESARAPGADDNASGTAVVLELARILSQVDLEDSVRFAFFSGEEQGFWGSKHYAQFIQDNGINLHRLINLDMVGYSPSTQQSVYVERDLGNANSSNDTDSQAFGQIMEQMAIDYTDLQVVLGPIYASDYMPFEARGYVVVGAYEKESNPDYHNSSDVPSTLDMSFAASVARMALATILKESAAVIDESSSAVDIYIRDNDTDDGSQPSGTVHWKSPDIWVRQNPPPADPNDPNDPNYGENPDNGHQSPIVGISNYMYVNVHNHGTLAATGVTVEAFHCNPGTQMIWPSHFVSMGTLSVAETIAPEGTKRVGPFTWTPNVPDHECLLAIARHSNDHSIPDIYHGSMEHGILVRYDNNIGQRNVSPKYLVPGGKFMTRFVIRGMEFATWNKLIVDSSSLPSGSKVILRIPRRLTRGIRQKNFWLTHNRNWSYLKILRGDKGSIEKIRMGKDEQAWVFMKLTLSNLARHKRIYPLSIIQETEGNIVGRLTFEINTVKDSDDFVYGNPRSREIHRITCPFWRRISPGNKIPFPTIKEALKRGYNGCRYCMPEHDSG